MCGIAGYWQRSGAAPDAEDVIRAMTDRLRHRGPDDQGMWCEFDRGIALGHRRLAIIDLTQEGHQPMVSTTGRYVVVFNGEIYNYRELRKELSERGVTFRGCSDTEVMLAAFERWGVLEGISRLAGMFAIAVWDRSGQKLFLIRDRLGEKPLYYCASGSTVTFGSELRALRAHPSWQGRIDRGALALYFRHNCIPAPYSIFEKVRKVMPGSIVTFDATAVEGREHRYWSALDVAERGRRDPIRLGDDELTSELDTRMRQVIRQQMIADVPIGAFLSGGIDSSTIVALMQSESTRPVRTFTIGFHEEGYNEATHAAAVARHLGTEHTELYVTAQETLGVVPRLPELYDEPFADSSQIPTFLVSQLARAHVTVSLTGDGGDELLAGYNRYVLTRQLWRALNRVPLTARKTVASAVRGVPAARWDSVAEVMMPLVPKRYRHTRVGDKAHKLAQILPASSPRAIYRALTSHWPVPEEIVVGGVEPPTAVSSEIGWKNHMSLIERMMFLDLISYLPDDILVKVDRAAMAVSLECRAPFLDHRLAEFAWRIPLSQKIRAKRGKWILREVLSRYVPPSLIERPKMGFGIPIEHWLRGPLRDWALELLAPDRLRREGYLEPEPITRAWHEHQSGSRNWQYRLWDVLMFQAWLAAQ